MQAAPGVAHLHFDVLVRRIPRVVLAAPSTPAGVVLTVVRDRSSTAVALAAVGGDAPTPEAMVALFEGDRTPDAVALWSCPIRPTRIVVDDDLLWSAGDVAEWCRREDVIVEHAPIRALRPREVEAWMDETCRALGRSLARRRPPRDVLGRMVVTMDAFAEAAQAWRRAVEARPCPTTGVPVHERWAATLAARSVTGAAGGDAPSLPGPGGS